jgi:hypothetical protein
MEQINKNYRPNKKRAFIQIFGLLGLSFLMVFGGLIFRNIIHHDYPLVFVDSNNKLMYITKSDNNKNDIIESGDNQLWHDFEAKLPNLIRRLNLRVYN